MQVSFLHNHLNGYFLSPIPCCAREENLIMIFLISSINNGLNPTIFIVYLVNQTASVLKSLFSLCFSLQLLIMSSKSSKIAKNKHGVRMRGVPKETSSTPIPAETPISTTTEQHPEVEFSSMQFQALSNVISQRSCSRLAHPKGIAPPCQERVLSLLRILFQWSKKKKSTLMQL